MQCPRCEGFMVSERFQDLKNYTRELYFIGSRCVVCGEILDPTILKNRKELELEAA